MKRYIKFALQVAATVLCSTVAATAQDGIVSIDGVTNVSSSGSLMAGNTHQVSIRYDFRDLPDDDWWKTWNAFEVYSPDGADWGYLRGNTGPLIATVDDRGTLCMFLKHYYFDGSDWTQTGDIGWDPAPGSGGPETRAGTFIQVGCLTMGVGFMGGLDNDIALLFEFETSVTDAGRTICIDTNSAITSWGWAKGSSSDFPLWDNGLGVDGPRCLEIVDCSSGDDSDGDSWVDGCDNCPLHYNPDQADANDDGIGDACNNEVWLEPGSGFLNDTTLLPGAEHRVTFWYVGRGFTCDMRWQGANGWKLFSPDGADWGYAQMHLRPEFTSVIDGGLFLKHYHKTAGSGFWEQTANGGLDPVVSDGSGTDSAGWYVAMITLDPSAYLPVGWEGPVLEIEFTSYPDDADKHLCVDTNAAITAWEWACGSELAYPLWDYPEPICFVIPDCPGGDDTDGDSWVDGCDNCPDHYNPDQADANSDGIGDACNSEVWFEPSSGFIDDSTLLPGDTHEITVSFVVRSFTNQDSWSGSNAWKLYSPDGADWGYFTGSPTQEFLDALDGTPVFQKAYYKEGGTGLWQHTDNNGQDPAPGNLTGTDTVGWYMAIGLCMGVCAPDGYEGTAAKLVFTSHSDDAGKSICFDTTSEIQPWEWAAGSQSAFPLWDYREPTCFVIPDCTEGDDTDGDGWADFCDACPGYDDNLDADGDGIPDGCDWCEDPPGDPDSDGDGVGDFCDLCPGFDDRIDSDGDHIPDGCDPVFNEWESIHIDHVDGLSESGEIMSGRTVTFYFRVLTGAEPVYGASNSFVVYSPDGAVLQTPQIDTVAGFREATVGDSPGLSVNLNVSADGVEYDTVGIVISDNYYEIFPSSLNEVLFAITTLANSDQIGKTVCLDWVYVTRLWRWYGSASPIYPNWGGPYCFEIGPECCIGRVGDVNLIGGDTPTISDITTLIDHLFISGVELPCLEEADVNQSGGADPTEDDITIGDISWLIEHLFYSGIPVPDCL